MARAAVEIFGQHDALGLEAGGLRIGDIVRRHVHGAAQGQLTGQPDEHRIVHGAVKASFWRCAPARVSPRPDAFILRKGRAMVNALIFMRLDARQGKLPSALLPACCAARQFLPTSRRFQTDR
jgi:hypothetical protein